jgi:hypothetical protein
MEETAMKKTLFLTLLLSGFAGSASFAGEICLAQKITHVSYGGEMHYKVMCKDKGFETQRNVTMFLLPLPYNWNKTALKNLDKAMKKKGLVQVLSAPQPSAISGELGTLRVFEAQGSNASYCLAYSYRANTTRMASNEVRSDVVIACGAQEESYSSVSVTELNQHLFARGYRPELTAKVDPVEVRIGESVVPVQTVTVFKK